MTGTSPNITLGQAILIEVLHRVEANYLRIKHCLQQLTDEQIWWRPQESLNSIGNLVLHLCGNMMQWMVNGVRQTPDTRNRPQEFAERAQVPGSELLQRLDGVLTVVRDVLAEGTDARLLEPRRIQGFEETVLSALLNSLTHFTGHTQEIVYITRLQLGDRYRFAWAPRTREEGATP